VPAISTVSSVEEFSLPNPCGRAGGACTSTLLNVLYKDHKDSSGDLSYTEVMEQMRVILKGKDFTQIPQVCCQLHY
jgi:metacaspase-1